MKVSKEGTRIKITWRSEDSKDVERARDFFMKLTRQNWLAAKRNSELQRILEFKSEYGELWFIPLVEGG
jgi:hypothetical protein